VFLCEKAIRMDPTLAELKRLMFAKWAPEKKLSKTSVSNLRL
jgi:hypothetical protein